jgi:hypothetical protein
VIHPVRYIAPVLFLIIASAASAQRSRSLVLDGTSARTFQASMTKIASRLGFRDRRAFKTALGLLLDGAPKRSRIRERYHGKTAKHILELYASLLRQYDANKNKKLDTGERATFDQKVFGYQRRQFEGMVRATLTGFLAAQNDVRGTRAIDVDGDGVGEFGFLVEMNGTAARRGSPGKPGKKERSYYCSRTWEYADGRASDENGYIFQIFLPGKDGVPIGETAKGPAGLPKPSPEHASKAWCAYAWPIELGRTGTRAFFISQAGQILESTESRLSGTNAPKGTEALPKGTTSLVGLDGKRRKGNDGSVWKPVRSGGARPGR